MSRGVCVTAFGAPPARHLLEALSADPAISRVVCVRARALSATPPAVPAVHWLEADFDSYRGLRTLLSSEALRGVDTLIHFPSEWTDELQHDGQGKTSSDSTHALLQAAEEHSAIDRFVLRSFGSLYRLDSREPVFIDERHALDLVHLPKRLRACAEADFVACEKLAGNRMKIVILRCAEVLAREHASQLFDYLNSRVCLRALGYDPMLNVLSLADFAQAIRLAASANVTGIFNIPGRDTLPLSELIHKTGRLDLPLPGPLLRPLYNLRARLTERRFEYATDAVRFHFGAVLDGQKARAQLGYVPRHPVAFDQLFGRA